MTITMHIHELTKITNEIAQQRRLQRQVAAGRLRKLRTILLPLTQTFDSQEADWLIEAHLRLRSPDLAKITVDLPDPNAPDERFYPPAPYSRLLGGELELLVLVGSDRLFVGPESCADVDKATALMDKLAELSVVESVALHALLDGAEKIPVAVYNHMEWWHVDNLVYLLESPHAEKAPY